MKESLMLHKLSPLPFHIDALSPHISSETIEYHYGKHHKGYVENLNKLIIGTEYEEMALDTIIKKASIGSIFNNAAQIWNHTFYWNSLAPKAAGNPRGTVGDLIINKWFNFENFKNEFTDNAVTNFGSGWTWLVQKSDGELEIIKTSNAETPMKQNIFKPILVIDLWEHAYYIDYRNSRAKYIENFWKLVNWDFANKNLIV